MTPSQIHPRTRSRTIRARRAFTLVEIITVIVILLVLMSIVLPMLATAMRSARKTRVASDMQAITTGLDAYKADFGDYPRPEAENTGFALLGKALLAPGPGFGIPNHTGGSAGAGTIASTGTPGQTGYQEYVAFGLPNGEGGFTAPGGPPDVNNWATFFASDGKDGAGFRARPGGKTYGPYLPDGKFRVRGLAILDLWDNPILYFPARPKKPTPPLGGGGWPLLSATAAPADQAGALYNTFNNITFFTRPGDTDLVKARDRMEALLVQGNTNWNGLIDPGETAVTDKSFLLWSAGADGNFGPTFAGADPTADEIRKVDDVTNFTTGQ